MVQRNVHDKIGVQGYHVKRPEKRSGSLKHLFQHQDAKSRGPELRKKMKKSRSMKLSSNERLVSPPSRKKVVLQPGGQPTGEQTPQKQPVIRSMQGSPNYMKGTSSSEAKRESSQVSPLSAQNLRRRSSSDSKLVKSFSRTSSLKKVKTLTKTPSFKPARAKSTKKCPAIAFCSEVDVRRATCSSTLKDTKFPAYLELSPGGTEAEGTSTMKVCPYTYCSLNGHHHYPSPPLKAFILATRRSLKTQKSTKLEVLTPGKAEPADCGAEGNHMDVMISNNEPTEEDLDVGNLPESPLTQEMGMDCFVQIYSKGKNYYGEQDGKGTEEDHENEDKDSYEGDGDSRASELEEIQVTESLSSGPPHSETDPEDDFRYFFERFPVDMDGIGSFVRDQNIKDAKDDHTTFSDPVEETISFCNESNFEATDTEWNKGEFSATKPDDNSDNSAKTDEETDMNVEPILEITSISSFGTLRNHKGGIPDEEKSQDIIEEEDAYDIAQSDDSDLEIDGRWKYLEILEYGPTSESLVQSQLSPDDAEAVDADSTKEKSVAGVTNFPGTFNTLPTLEESIMDTTSPKDEKELHICGDSELDKDGSKEDAHQCHEPTWPLEKPAVAGTTAESNTNEDAAEEILHAEGGNRVEHNIKDHSFLEKLESDAGDVTSPSFRDPDEQDGSEKFRLALAENNYIDTKETKQAEPESDASKPSLKATRETIETQGSEFSTTRKASKQELPHAYPTHGWRIKRKIRTDEHEYLKKFNPREPNYLPIIPEPDAEKVDLKHQEIECRKNAEEWMLDHALQQVVTELAPARKRKVALLVEAFETATTNTKQLKKFAAQDVNEVSHLATN